MDELKNAWRSLRRHRWLSVVVIFILALAIGANTAIFSVMDSLLFRALPARDPGSLLLLQWSAAPPPKGIQFSMNYGDCDLFFSPTREESCSFSLPFFRSLQQNVRTLTGVTAYGNDSQTAIRARGETTVAQTQLVAGNYFQLLGLQPLLGRLLTPADDRPGAPQVMVLSAAYWRQRFGADRGIVGATVSVNQHPVTVVGVAQTGFRGLTPGYVFNAWLPLADRADWMPFASPESASAGATWLVLIARPRPGISAAAVSAEINGRFRDAFLHGSPPLAQPGDHLHAWALPAQAALSGARAQFAQPLWLLLGLVGAILLIACANVAGLLVGRAQMRSKEFALRRALGASAGRLLRQTVSESLLLAICGGVAGLGLAWVAAHELAAALAASAQFMPQLLAAPLHGRVLLFALGATVLTGVLAGLAPAFYARRGSLAGALKDGVGNATSASYPSTPRRRLRWLHLGNLLVVAQVALCVLMLAGAGLLVRTFRNLSSIEPGFNPHNVLLFSLEPVAEGYQGARLRVLLDRVQQNIAALPGVRSVGYSGLALLSGGAMDNDVTVTPTSKPADVYWLPVGSGFFSTMGMRLLQGRHFRSTDFRAISGPGTPQPKNPPVLSVIVNEAFAHEYLGGGNVIGRDFGYGKDNPKPQYTVIGVVSNAHYDSLRGAYPPTIYQDGNWGSASFAVRTAGAPLALLGSVRRVLRQIDPNLPLIDPTTQTATIAGLLFQPRLLARLAALLAALALLLAAIGLYALLAQEVTRRTREIGIRMALGAARGHVLRSVLGLGMGLAAAGLAVGVAGAWAFTRYLHSFLYGVEAMDPWTLAAAGVLLLLVALAACWLPGSRATRVDPLVALRYE
ncbi:MAG: ABC transporter permease [Terriglobales bacterium]